MPSKDEFLRLSQVKQVILRNKENNTPAKCINTDEPTLGKLLRTYGDEFTEKYLCVWLIEIQEMLGVKNKMNDFQIEMCAQMLLDEFKQINLSDLQLVAKRAISGVYGQFYESISIPKVLEWFRLYFEERCETGAMINTQIKASGQIEAQASDTVKALIELGVINLDDFKAMDVNKEEEFRKVNAEYHAKKITESKNS
jgi:hypothetical protein